MRFFAELAYNGTPFNGWQKQPDAPSVQKEIEVALSTILRSEIEIVGCGRTDTGVHASQYFIHFDFDGTFPEYFIDRINRFLRPEIAIFRIWEVEPDMHARFDAVYRAYEYHISWKKDPFSIDTAYYNSYAKGFSFEKLQASAKLLLNYNEFFPFCKTNTDVKTMECQLFRSEWERDEAKSKLVFHIAANRFLRGMVRLIVGMCMNVAQGKVAFEEVKKALEEQSRLKKAESAPPQGLFLTQIKY